MGWSNDTIVSTWCVSFQTHLKILALCFLKNLHFCMSWKFYSNLKTKVEAVVASLRIMTPPEFKLNLRGSDMIKKGKRMYFLLNVGKWLLYHMNLSDIDPSTVALALFECIREFTLSSLTTWVYHGVFLKVKMLNMGQTRFSTSLLAILVKQKELMTWHAS